MKLQSTLQTIVRIAIIVLVVEYLMMLFLGSSTVLQSLGADLLAIFNALGLVTITTPLIYLFVIRPFINERNKAYDQLHHLACSDPLTQLPNRRHFLMMLEKTMANCVRYKDYGALFVIDLDGFKPVNDTYGHDAGDVVLIEFASRLKSITRAGEHVCRIGGDEFVVLVDHLGGNKQNAHTNAAELAAKLSHIGKSPYSVDGRELYVGLSVGLRLLEIDSLDQEKVLREADSAMYKAKESGKGCFISFEDHLTQTLAADN